MNWVRSIIEKRTLSIVGAAGIIGVASLVSRFLGLLRDRIFADRFGAGDVLDAYFVAFRIPDTIFTLFVLGALSSAFIPVFSRYLVENKRQAWELVHTLLNITVLGLSLISLILFFLSPWLVDWIAPGFSDSTKDLALGLTRIMLLSPILFGISNIFGGVLNAMRRFVAYAIAPILYNLGIITGAIFFVPSMGPSGLAWGVILGAVMHMGIQLPAVMASGWRHRFSLMFRHPGLGQIVKLMFPRMLGLGVTQVNLLVITIVASTLTTGSVAVFNFANNLQSFPIGVFGISFAVAAFPALADAAARNQPNLFIRDLSSTFRQVLFFLLPITVFVLGVREQIVRLVLGTGAFDWEDTVLTFDTLGYFGLSLFAQALIPLLARSFYALEDTKTPFYSSLVGMAVNIALVIPLGDRFGVAGLALAFSIATIANFALLLLLLHSRLGSLDDKVMFSSLTKMVTTSIILAVVSFWSLRIFALFVATDTYLGLLIQTVGTMIAGGVIYILMSYWLRIPETKTLLPMVKRVFSWNRNGYSNGESATS